MKNRFIKFQRYNPYFKTGLNQALMESVRDSDQRIFFLAGWNRKCVNIGRSQTLSEVLNLENVKEDDICIVRRQGGGGATFLTPKGEITWGIVAPSDEFSDDVNRIYKNVCGRIAEALSEIGIDAEHEPINDIVTSKGKISGATLKQKDGVTYVGGTLLFEVDAEEMFQYLTPGEDKLRDKQIRDYRDRISCVSQETDADYAEAQEALKKGLINRKEFQESDLTAKEVERAEELAKKYKSQKWIYRAE